MSSVDSVATRPIILYGHARCPQVGPVRRILSGANVPFEYVNIHEDGAAAERVRQINGGNESVPTLIFLNKIDRAGADPERVTEAMRRRLSPGVLAMGSVRDPGWPDATFVPFGNDDAAHRAGIQYYPKVLVGVPFTPVTGHRFITAAGEDRGQMIGFISGEFNAFAVGTASAGSLQVILVQDNAGVMSKSMRDRAPGLCGAEP